jgi:hypothetical protein
VGTDTRDMRKRNRTIDKILEAFADSVAAYEVERAEGWLAVAVWIQGISEKAIPVPVR